MKLMRRTTSLIGLALVIIGAILIPLSRTPAQTTDYLWQSNVNFYAGQVARSGFCNITDIASESN